jgi:hypothetical protein
MRIARFDPKARGIVCAVKRANVIGQWISGQHQGQPGVKTSIDRPKT